MSTATDLAHVPHAHSSRCYWDFRRPGWVCRSVPVEVRVPEQRAGTAAEPVPALIPG